MSRRTCRTCGLPTPPKGVLVIDDQNLLAMEGGKRCRGLSNSEFLILQALAEKPGRTVRRAVLEESASMDGLNASALSVTLAHLRAKIGRDRIVCIEGRGYLLAGKVKKEALA